MPTVGRFACWSKLFQEERRGNWGTRIISSSSSSIAVGTVSTVSLSGSSWVTLGWLDSPPFWLGASGLHTLSDGGETKFIPRCLSSLSCYWLFLSFLLVLWHAFHAINFLHLSCALERVEFVVRLSLEMVLGGVVPYFLLVNTGGCADGLWYHWVNRCGWPFAHPRIWCWVHPRRWHVIHLLRDPPVLPWHLVLGKNIGQWT